ncbi:MAG: D-amino-acid transaminase [Silicimonas sp.]|jgi:D-alanine transaminase|nr:D-amino-acid transaminase [Silicimonas sp.]
MTLRTVYLDGEFLRETEAKVSIFDRGYLMADAVYEFTAVIDGKLIDFEGHMVRLQRSLNELQFGFEPDREELLAIHRQLVKANDIDVGGVYLQVSRGVADRDFVFPTGTAPTVMAFTQAINFLAHPLVETGIDVVSVEDGRWARRDIKTVQLLYTSMVKTQAVAKGAHDAFFVQDGYVTEATSANAFIVKDDAIITRKLSHDLLHGVTRRAVLALAESVGLKVDERPFTIEEAQQADEAFITASPLYVLPVVSVDGVKVGAGRPGPVTTGLRTTFLEEAMKQAV